MKYLKTNVMDADTLGPALRHQSIRRTTRAMMKPMTYKGPFARLRWQMLQVIQSALLENGGTIFGGFVRDKILHDHYADAFYLAMEQESEKHKKYINPGVAYDKPDVHPESWPWRAVMPQDVDVAIPTDKISGFKDALEQDGFTVREEFETTASIYCDNPHAQAHNIKHTRLIVELKVHRLVSRYTSVFAQVPKIKVDILHKAAFDTRDVIPFGTIDFECNSLVLKPDNTYDLMNSPMLCNPLHKSKKISDIIKDITQRKAVSVKPAAYRTSHILSKGFVVTNGVITLEPARDPVAASSVEGSVEQGGQGGEGIGHCIICQDVLECVMCPLRRYASTSFVVKNNCCEARYHAKCYNDSRNNARTSYNNKAKCMMCRSDIPKCGACVRMRKNSGFKMTGVSLTQWDNPDQDVCRGGCGSRNGSDYNHLLAFIRHAVLRYPTGVQAAEEDDDSAIEVIPSPPLPNNVVAPPAAIMDLRNLAGLLDHNEDDRHALENQSSGDITDVDDNAIVDQE